MLDETLVYHVWGGGRPAAAFRGRPDGAIDPYFHYHKPLPGLAYRIYNERYQNDGIAKHFDYDAVITGTSMTQNFKASEFGRLFGCHCVKMPFSGASYREVSENLKRAIQANHNIKTVLWGLDYNSFFRDPDEMRYEGYPAYLYDSQPFNDVEYIFNKEVLFGDTYGSVLAYTRGGGKTTTFDEYNNWDGQYEYGKEAVLSQYTRPQRAEKQGALHLDPRNLNQNVVSVVKENPQIQFYLFFTPYSIVYWDSLNQQGTLQNQLRMEKEAIELLLPYENIHLYSFFDEFGVITDLNHYKDSGHYSGKVNDFIMECMAKGDHKLTEENYQEYWGNVWDFYTSYDYGALFE